MTQKETIILGLIFAAFVALVAFDWRRVFGATMETQPLQAAPVITDSTGPVSSWANVPTSRIVLPANLGGYAAQDANNTSPPMFECGCMS